MSSLFDPVQGTYSAPSLQGVGSSDPKILAAEQAARQAQLNMGMGPGYSQGVDPSVYQTLYSTNPQGQVVRNSDGYVSQTNMGGIQNPNAQQYYGRNPQEAFFLGSVGKGQFQDANVRGTNTKLGQLTPDQWYRGYTSGFEKGWDQDTSNGYRWAGQDSQPTGQNGMGNVGSGSNGGYGSSSSSSSTGSTGLNPYLTQAQQALTGQITDNLNRNIMPGLSSAAIASGNYGGSRQGVIEANALNDANRQIANGMANLSYNAWDSDANRALQQQQIDNSYNLGMTGQQNNFYTAQRGQDLQSTALGAQLMNMGNQGYLNQGQGMYNVGATYQTAPWQVVGSFNSAMSPWGNQTGSVSGGQSSNPWASALGGAMGGAQLGKLFG